MTRILGLMPRTERFLSLRPEMGLLGRFFPDFELPDLFGEERLPVPAFDVSETEKEYVITGEISGVDMKDLDVTLSDGTLTIKGEKKQEKEEKDEHYHRVERHYGSFERSFRIPDNVKADKSKATYKDGVLKLVLPKTKAHKVKKIEVKENKPREKSKRQQKTH